MVSEQPDTTRIVKTSGEAVQFSEGKLRKSLHHSGAEPEVIDAIVRTLKDELYEGMRTREIHNRAFALLKTYNNVCASRYKLKRAIYELGPTGFPFEKFVSALLNHSGYQTRTNEVLPGACVSHEVDVVARNGRTLTLIECKFHADEGRKCTVKVPLYIDSRYRDIRKHFERHGDADLQLKPGWVVTNTRFTRDALAYGKCAGLYLLSWNLPKGDSLKERIDRYRLYPVTVSVLLSREEKDFLLSREIVLCRQLIEAPYLLDHLGMSESRKRRVLEESRLLCNLIPQS